MGYGHVYPQTTDGRIAAMALPLLGMGLFGAITATIMGYLMTSDLRRIEAKVEADVELDQAEAERATRRTTTAVESTASAQPPSSPTSNAWLPSTVRET